MCFRGFGLKVDITGIGVDWLSLRWTVRCCWARGAHLQVRCRLVTVGGGHLLVRSKLGVVKTSPS